MNTLFTPARWYWIVGHEGPHLPDGATKHPSHAEVYSSQAGRYTDLQDTNYLNWREPLAKKMGGAEPTTRIASEAELVEVLRAHGIKFGEPA